MANNPVSGSGATRLVGRESLRRLLQERKLLIESLLAPSQVDNIGIDLRLDCFFREFVRTDEVAQGPRWNPAALN
jgi:hypothetical protein